MQTIVAYVVESSIALLTGNYLFQMELPVVFAIYALAHLLIFVHSIGDREKDFSTALRFVTA